MNHSIHLNAQGLRGASPFISALMASMLGMGMLDRQAQDAATRTELDSLKMHMSGVLKRLVSLDAGRDPEQLRLRYDPEGEGFDHPYASREEWRQEVAEGETELGYWAWIVERLDEHALVIAQAEEEQRQAEQAKQEAAAQQEEAQTEPSSAGCPGCANCDQG